MSFSFPASRSVLLALAAIFAAAPVVQALTPDQVAVIVNDKSEKSRTIAEYYTKVRQIPADHLITISVKPQENISDEDYRTQIAEPIRKALLEKKLDQTITCLVTTYDVPLRTDNIAPTTAEKVEITAYQKALAAGRAELQEVTAKLDRVAAPQPAASSPASQAAPAKMPDLGTQIEQFKKAAQSAISRLNALDAAQRAKLAPAYRELQQAGFGLTLPPKFPQLTAEPAATQTQPAQSQPSVDPRVLEINRQQAALAATPADQDKKRLEILTLEREKSGLIGYCQKAESFSHLFDHRETYACVDSELMLLWVKDYSREGMLPNPKCIGGGSGRRRRGAETTLTSEDRIMITARLDGTSVEKVISMIDTSIRVEKDGLDGVAYFDAGFARIPSYDHEIIAAGEYLQKNAAMQVVIDTKPELLKAKDCPNAALYCGWYSLKNYQDSCQWLPGAVGFHIASFEMISLHDPHEFGWVAALLNHGFCGTLGPGYEPYVNAFPNPRLFFPLLVSGQYTQGEVWYLTCPTVSWAMGYVGDPLYNPFFNKPRLSAEQIAADPLLAKAAEILPPAKVTAPIPPKPVTTTAPSTAPATAPAK